MNSTFTMILRFLLGLILIVFGINKLIPWNVLPNSELSENAINFINSATVTNFGYAIVGILEIGLGAMLLLRKWVPFALLVLTPIALSILLWNILTGSSAIILSVAILLLNGVLIYKYRPNFKSLFYS